LKYKNRQNLDFANLTLGMLLAKIRKNLAMNGGVCCFGKEFDSGV